MPVHQRFQRSCLKRNEINTLALNSCWPMFVALRRLFEWVSPLPLIMLVVGT